MGKRELIDIAGELRGESEEGISNLRRQDD
jgi:hypothetical protein